MRAEGLNLEFLDTDRNLCERSHNIILVKNLNYNTQPNDLKELFNFYGIVDRLLLCPNKTIAIVEFQSEEFAKNAFEKLSYYKFKSQPLYLEWAPINLITKEKIAKKL
jgi:multiple RNA-binding domain-containing protein 1